MVFVQIPDGCPSADAEWGMMNLPVTEVKIGEARHRREWAGGNWSGYCGRLHNGYRIHSNLKKPISLRRLGLNGDNLMNFCTWEYEARLSAVEIYLAWV